MSSLEEQIERPLLTQEQIRFGIERFRKLNIEKEEDKKCLIDNFINAIYLYDDKITFTFNYKDGTKTVLLSECDSSSVGSDTYSFGPPKTHFYSWKCVFSLHKCIKIAKKYSKKAKKHPFGTRIWDITVGVSYFD